MSIAYLIFGGVFFVYYYYIFVVVVVVSFVCLFFVCCFWGDFLMEVDKNVSMETYLFT